MATITTNDKAPEGAVKYVFPTETFDLNSGDTKDTLDQELLRAAEAHPWLRVEYPELEELAVTREPTSVPYADDYLSAPNTKAFDPEEVRRVESEKRSATEAPVAVEAGLVQTEDDHVGNVAVTLAAYDPQEDDE